MFLFLEIQPFGRRQKYRYRLSIPFTLLINFDFMMMDCRVHR